MPDSFGERFNVRVVDGHTPRTLFNQGLCRLREGIQQMSYTYTRD
jgi:hypothetical protein